MSQQSDIAYTNVEVHVLIRGLKLDDSTLALIEASVRSAVLQEMAAIDNKGGPPKILSPDGDPQTRSLLSVPRVLGLVMQSA